MRIRFIKGEFFGQVKDIRPDIIARTYIAQGIAIDANAPWSPPAPVSTTAPGFTPTAIVPASPITTTPTYVKPTAVPPLPSAPAAGPAPAPAPSHPSQTAPALPVPSSSSSSSSGGCADCGGSTQGAAPGLAGNLVQQVPTDATPAAASGTPSSSAALGTPAASGARSSTALWVLVALMVAVAVAFALAKK